MLFKNITIIDENFNSEQNMYVGIEGEKITYISKKEPQKEFGRIYEGKDKLLMSGFVNSHGHSPMALMRGYGENMILQDWLEQKIFPFEAKLDGNAVYWGTLLSMAESLRFGIVSTTDMYDFHENMVEAILTSGAKSNLSRAITNFKDEDIWQLAGGREMMDLYKNYHNIGGGKLKVDMGLHAEYTSTEKTVIQLADFTRELGVNMQVHVSETQAEHENCKAKYGLTPVAYLNKHGLFDTPTTAAHCVWIEGEDFDILKEKGVTVACNPVSNMKLASGICNTPKLLANGINVGIGTDSVASNNNLNFIEELKYFATVAKTRNSDPSAISSKEAIIAGTYSGAKAQGRTDCGKLAINNRADLIVIDISGPHMKPVHNLLNNLVYSASGSDVIMTMVDGKILYENGEYLTIDIEKTIAEVDRAKDKILKAL
ncbi:MAG: amidohydrolase [Anaerovoracaceae bacterium]